MNPTRMLTVALVCAALTGGAVTLFAKAAPKPRPAAASAKAGDKVARGEYLATVSGCNDCHTPGTLFGSPDFSRRLSGSELGWQGPWGVTYAKNLTPDPETGIGKWSEDDIVNTLRTGQRPDHSPLLPPMPWQNLTVMTDQDLHALAAYLKSLPAVKHQVPAVVPPGQPVAGSVVVFPPPSAWDAPRQSEDVQPPAGAGDKK